MRRGNMSKYCIKDLELPDNLKMRAWNNTKKRYYYLRIGKDGSKFRFYPVDEDGKIRSHGYDFETVILNSENEWEKPEQSTGYRDKNGTLVYVGDILLFSYRDVGKKFMFTVESLESFFSYMTDFRSVDGKGNFYPPGAVIISNIMDKKNEFT